MNKEDALELIRKYKIIDIAVDKTIIYPSNSFNDIVLELFPDKK